MADLSNFPRPPGRNSINSNSFPNDLINGTRDFYTEITFGQYNFTMAGGAGALSLGGSILLPIPKKLNDNEVIIWEEWSGRDTLGQAGATAITTLAGSMGSVAGGLVAGVAMSSAPLASIVTGKQVNPFQYMMFSRPGFKEHTLQWSLSPNSPQESETLKSIIKRCKKAALPTPEGFALMKYPEIALVKFHPNNYLYTLKPCAIISVQVDYTGAGPSFFKTGAPTVVGLTLQLKEIQLWQSTDADLQG